MTCIVAIKSNKKIYMGCDSAGTDSQFNLIVRKDPKIFFNGPFLIGYCDSFRMGQILQHKFKPPQQKRGTSDFEFMTTVFIDEVRKCFKDNGFSHIEDNEEIGGTFLVAYKGEIYCVEEDYQVGVHVFPFNATGAGQEIALGSLFSTYQSKTLSPEQKLTIALKASEQFNASVRSPFRFLTT